MEVQVLSPAPVVTCSELKIWSDFAEAKGLSQGKLERLADVVIIRLLKWNREKTKTRHRTRSKRLQKP